MQLHQAIYKIEKALSQKWCKNLIKYMDIQCTEKAKVLIDGKDVEDTSQRNVYTHGLNSESPNDEVYIEILLKVMNNCLKEYTKTYSYIRECSPQDINLLKYKKGNFYKKVDKDGKDTGEYNIKTNAKSIAATNGFSSYVNIPATDRAGNTKPTYIFPINTDYSK